MSRPPMPAPPPPAAPERDAFAEELEMKLRGVDGSVRASLVKQINKIVEKSPEAFVKNMRNWLHQGRGNDD
ncbi:hypothetical protein [Elstera sp.]|uniref:hypothetical protein n=1 Tax=Elstera sp. TaxID=1916664 RepID=UPI0037BFB4D7